MYVSCTREALSLTRGSWSTVYCLDYPIDQNQGPMSGLAQLCSGNWDMPMAHRICQYETLMIFGEEEKISVKCLKFTEHFSRAGNGIEITYTFHSNAPQFLTQFPHISCKWGTRFHRICGRTLVETENSKNYISGQRNECCTKSLLARKAICQRFTAVKRRGEDSQEEFRNNLSTDLNRTQEQ